MELHRYIRRILTLLVTMALFACTHDDYLPSAEGEEAIVTFCPSLDNAMNTRAIGDATGIDQLVVAVYEGSKTKRKVHTQTFSWTEAQQKGISLRLIEGRTYHIIFWAQHADNTDNKAYTLTDDGMITVNYSQYQTGGFSKMEEMDAFYATAEVTVGTTPEEDKGTITLTRPLAQVNFADNTTQPVQGTHKAVVTFHGYPTSYNPFSGEVTMSESDISFTFTDFPDESLSVDNNTYYYLSSNYLFVPRESTATLCATLDLQNADGTSIKTVSLENVTGEKNKKTNIAGSIVPVPVTKTTCIKRWDKHSKCPMIGKVYYVSALDQKGTVTLDGKSIF